MAKINHSLEWNQVQMQLEQSARRTGKHTDDMIRVSQNIGFMVIELSKEEVNCRRAGKQTKKHIELLAKINDEIANYEQMLTFATLLGG